VARSNYVRLLSGVLVTALVAEVLFLRILARAGIYMLNEDSPEIARSAYSALLFLGNVAFNLASIASLALLLAIAVSAARTRSSGAWMLAVALLLPLGAAVAVQALGGSQAASTALLVSVLLALGVVIVVAGGDSFGFGRVALAAFGAAAAMAIVAKFLPIAARVWGTGTGAVDELSAASEAAMFLAPGLVVVAAGLGIHRKALAAAAVATLVAALLGASNASMVPLIATWAFGVTLSLPYPFYVFAAALAAYAVSALVLERRWMILTALAFLLLGHKGLSLTYFNILALDGMALMGLSLSGRVGAAATVKEMTPTALASNRHPKAAL